MKNVAPIKKILEKHGIHSQALAVELLLLFNTDIEKKKKKK